MSGAVVDGLAGPEVLLTAVVGTQEPEIREGVDPEDVSPGLLGFLVIFAVALACIPLFRSMTSKLRRVDHRARLEAEAEGATPDGGATPEGGVGPEAPGSGASPHDGAAPGPLSPDGPGGPAGPDRPRR